MTDKNELIHQIIQGEWRMFSEVNEASSGSPGEHRPSCRDFPDEFRIHRTAKLMPWSVNTLRSYLADIKAAQAKGRNFMTLKYARMDRLIPRENNSPMIDLITEALVKWQKAFTKKHPVLMTGGRRVSGGTPGVDWPSFENYLRCELETYSEATLSSLYEDISAMKKNGESMSEAVYQELARLKGFDSIEDAQNNK